MRSAVLVSALSALIVAGCGPHVVRTATNLPVEQQLQLQHLPRVWVAGFVANSGSDGIDLNTEAVRAVRRFLRVETDATVVDADPLNLDHAQVFEDESYWRRLGEEYNASLIITGDVNLLLAPATVVQRGRRTAYLGRSGRTLKAEVVLIDGTTGRIVSQQQLPSRMKYGDRDVASGLGLYLDMMEQSRWAWLRAIASGAMLNAGPRSN